MNKATKGALAAAAAGSLMLGGAGSLAYWTGTQDVTGGSIGSGKLALSAPSCATNVPLGTHDWQYDGGSAFTIATSKVAPGDTITKVCNMTLTLVGDHVGATLALETASITSDGSALTTLDTELSPTATFKVDGATYAPITAPGTYVVQATVTVTFPTTGTNSSQDLAAALDDMTLTATQTHDTAA
ncbi:MAG: alternate-type signal peptide protein [Nocardioides sp.]|jgi:alternate signal-mediated exported protein|nr:alternate-type signal peptide protein [Nocardioides sp.]